MNLQHVIKINAQGGVLTPLHLRTVVQFAASFGASHINFGPRQEIFFNVHKEKLQEFVDKASLQSLDFEIDQDIYPNIVSSYVAEGTLSDENWLTEGVYKDVFYQFDFKPLLKINICDSEQFLVPLFTGHLNFVSSKTRQYWYLYVRLPSSESLYCWKCLIYTTDIPRICREIQELYVQNNFTQIQEIEQVINENVSYLSLPYDRGLELPRYVFPYYEGMNRYADKFWLGIYRRDYLFSVRFLTELCDLCIHTHIAQLCTTTYRSILIKGITQEYRVQWEKLLGKHGINLRHSTNELNWVVDDINTSEVDIKNHIIRAFDQADTRTFGLVFGINLHSATYVPASIIIAQKPFFRRDNMRLFNVYDIYFKENFNPNSPNKFLFASNVVKSQLIHKLGQLIQKYYAQLGKPDIAMVVDTPSTKSTAIESHTVHQCTHCMTVYDSSYGDMLQGIEKGVPFYNLPADYRCPTCDAPTSAFKEVDFNELVVNNL